MIDLHSHILPGLDDGAVDLEESLGMAMTATREGIDTIVATPHVNHRYPVEPEAMSQAVGRLNVALARMELPLAVLPGAEVAMESAARLDGAVLRRLTLGGGSCLLVEAPYSGSFSFLENVLFDLQVRGFRLMLAHPERSLSFREHPERLGQLVERGVLACLNAGSIGGDFGRETQELALGFVEQGVAAVVASDSHNADARPPVLLAPFERADEQLPGIADLRTLFTQDAPAAILAGAPVPKAPALAQPKRSRWRRLKRPSART